MPIEAGDEFPDFPHGSDVGGNVERIGDQQQQYNALKHDRRKRGLDVGGESLPGNPADVRAHGLNRGHQREGQRHRPQHVEAELRARLGVGGDAAGVVVGHAGDEPRSDPRQRVFLQAAPKNLQRVHAPRWIDATIQAGMSVLGIWLEHGTLHLFWTQRTFPRCGCSVYLRKCPIRPANFGTDRPLQNRHEFLLAGYVEAARFSGGQLLVSFKTKRSYYRPQKSVAEIAGSGANSVKRDTRRPVQPPALIPVSRCVLPHHVI